MRAAIVYIVILLAVLIAVSYYVGTFYDIENFFGAAVRAIHQLDTYNPSTKQFNPGLGG